MYNILTEYPSWRVNNYRSIWALPSVYGANRKNTFEQIYINIFPTWAYDYKTFVWVHTEVSLIWLVNVDAELTFNQSYV